MMQILEIILWGRNGKKRTISLRPGQVNVITGGCSTGKTSLIDIVEYCLGRDECTVPVGIIRDQVSWFGLRLKFATDEVLVCRQNPNAGQTTSTAAYIDQGAEVASPDDPPTQPNTTIEAIINALSQRIGISPNRNIPPPDQTRAPLTANLRHALYYCFQEQNEIASRSTLFHRCADHWVNQSLKDTLPYFLGAVQEDRFALQQDLDRASRELRRAEQAWKEVQSIKGEGLEMATALLEEARSIGLLPPGQVPSEKDSLVKLLQQAARWCPVSDVWVGQDRVDEIKDDMSRLQSRIRSLEAQIYAAKTSAREVSGFSSEAVEQVNRLRSIHLFDCHKQENRACPLCSQVLPLPVPAASAISAVLSDLQTSLEKATAESPLLRKFIDKLETEKELLLEQVRQRQRMIESALAQVESARETRDMNVQRGRVAGRISLWLESVHMTDDVADLRRRLDAAKRRVEELEKALEQDVVDERLASILNRIGQRMTEWASQLSLEHSGNPVRLDPRRTTVVIDKDDRSISLKGDMGGGENWMGYHLVTHLALHDYFHRHSRPVPQFLFLDQLSQVYYPADKDSEYAGDVGGLKDEDRESLSRVYGLVFEVVAALSPRLQVIVLEHASLDSDQFQDAVIESWRHGKALIPADWIEG